MKVYYCRFVNASLCFINSSKVSKNWENAKNGILFVFAIEIDKSTSALFLVLNPHWIVYIANGFLLVFFTSNLYTNLKFDEMTANRRRFAPVLLYQSLITKFYFWPVFIRYFSLLHFFIFFRFCMFSWQTRCYSNFVNCISCRKKINFNGWNEWWGALHWNGSKFSIMKRI